MPPRFIPHDPTAQAFGWNDDSWLKHMQAAVAEPDLGCIGEVEILREVGRGGQGVVWQARQPGTGRLMALKGLLGGRLAGKNAEQRFEREVKLAAALNHPGIVTVYGLEQREGRPFLAMEWVDGVTITKWAGGKTLQERLQCFIAVCEAVAHGHQRGILHRDLKPSNLLVEENGQPRVLDFGLACSRQANEISLTGSGFLGSPAYASPEQLAGKRDLDERCDVYALGVVLYEILTGERTWGDPARWTGLIAEFERKRPAPPSRRRPGLPSELDLVVANAMADCVEERYASVEALAQDLRRYLQGRPVLAVAPTSWYLLRKLLLRNRAVSSLAASLIIGLVGFAWYANHQNGLLEHQRNVAQWEAQRFRNLVLYQPGCRLQRADWNPNDPRQPQDPNPEGIPPNQFAPNGDVPFGANMAAFTANKGGG
ncbi:MAG: serine/threonine protein kinase [Planctomycetes bacterium]|nr:serine/threonine protein kinase [Planctomycetota bacterium]